MSNLVLVLVLVLAACYLKECNYGSGSFPTLSPSGAGKTSRKNELIVAATRNNFSFGLCFWFWWEFHGHSLRNPQEDASIYSFCGVLLDVPSTASHMQSE